MRRHDQAKVESVAQSLMMNGIVANLNGLEANPDLISDENIDLDFKDVLNLVKAIIKNFGEDIPRMLVGAIDNFREWLAGFLGSLNKMGMLGSFGGLVALGSGIYPAGKGGRLADTPLE